MPPVGTYNHDSEFFTYQRRDLKIPNLKRYTPKDLGLTHGKHGNYYGEIPDDSFNPITAMNAAIDGKTCTKFKKTVTKADMDKYYSRDEVMYNTIDLKTNIDLENTKEYRAEDIRQ